MACTKMKINKSKKNISQPTVTPSEFKIKHPLLWLILATIILYIPTISMGVTDLDDGIFITDSDFNENLQNLFLSFQRTIFGSQSDLLYRPVSTDIMILNYHLANH